MDFENTTRWNLRGRLLLSVSSSIAVLTCFNLTAIAQNTSEGFAQNTFSPNETVYIIDDFPKRYAKIRLLQEMTVEVEHCDGEVRTAIPIEKVRPTTAKCDRNPSSPEVVSAPSDYVGASIYVSENNASSKVIEISSITEVNFSETDGWTAGFEAEGGKYSFSFDDQNIVSISESIGGAERKPGIILLKEFEFSKD